MKQKKLKTKMGKTLKEKRNETREKREENYDAELHEKFYNINS